MQLASMTTGAAATSRSVRKYTAAATRNNITPTKNTKKPSRSRSRRARNDGATADDLLAALKMLEETARTARHVLGAAHPTVGGIEVDLKTLRFGIKVRSLLSGAFFFAVAVVIVAWLWQSVIKK